ncbi:MAG: hypothetical protein WCK02_16115 [Bacteroidota bacterium]
MAIYFNRCNISAPGRINTKLDGQFQTIAIDNLNDKQLEQLFNNGCKYVELTSEGRKKYYPDENPIEVKETPKRK